MSHENKGKRLSGDLKIYRIIGGVEQPGLGPLNAEVITMQPNVEVIKVPDKRRLRRGQTQISISDPQDTTGSLTLNSVPADVLAQALLGDVAPYSQSAGSEAAHLVAVKPDYWTPLGKRNISNLVIESGVKASLATGTEVSDNAITWTAVAPGTDGNSITVALVDPVANNAALSVAVTDTDIVVNLATDDIGAITSTATQVMAAIAGSAAASALVTATDTGISDGSATVAPVAASNLTSGAASGGTTYTVGTDYEINPREASFRPLSTGTMSEGQVFASFDYGAVAATRVRVGTAITVRARLVLEGINDVDDSNFYWEAYSALMTPSGELDLMGNEPLKAEMALSFETPADRAMPIYYDEDVVYS